MVLITHGGENTEKINNILEVSQKRFGMYGFEKTAMREIASDLGISKASLYYYFPDKEHLFRAVLENEQTFFFQSLDEAFAVCSDAKMMFRSYIKIRLEFFKMFFNLGRLRLNEFRYMKTAILKEVLNNINNKELNIVCQILQKGIDDKDFIEMDIDSVAHLLTETVKGFRIQFMQNKEYLYIEQEEYNLMDKKLGQLTEILLRGLSI